MNPSDFHRVHFHTPRVMIMKVFRAAWRWAQCIGQVPVLRPAETCPWFRVTFKTEMTSWNFVCILDHQREHLIFTRDVPVFGTLVQATFVQNQILKRFFLWDCNQRKRVLRGSPVALSRYYRPGMSVLTVRCRVISFERFARMGESLFFYPCVKCYFP